MNRYSWIAAGALLLLVAGISCAHGHPGQVLLSLAVLFFLCFSGLPLARLLFRDRLVAVVFAFPAGYVLHAVVLSLLSAVLGVRPLSLGIDLAFAAILLFAFRKKAASEEGMDPVDTLLLFVWLLVVVLVTAPAFLNVGAQTDSGFAYRAYFNADFFRNMAVSGSLAHTGIPPLNPYFAEKVLHYYWFFHIIPAFWEQVFPSWRLDLILVQFSVAAVLMFTAALFVTIRSFVSDRRTMLLVLPIFTIGGSYEGLYVLRQLWEKHQSWRAFTSLNIDGILRWNWNAPQIDTLYRALLYAPQHLVPLAFVLMALCFIKSMKAGHYTLDVAAVGLLSFFIFSMLGFSVFVGAVLILAAGLELFLQFIRNPRQLWKGAAVFAVSGLVFLGLYDWVFQMFEAGSTPVRFGMDPAIAKHFFAYILLNWGALILIGPAGIFFHSPEFPSKPLLFFLVLCAILIFFVELVLPGVSDISLKMGHLSHIMLLCFAAGFLDWLLSRHPRRYGIILAGVLMLVLPASVTWLMDDYNSRDITNKKFTTYVARDDAELFEWMSRNLPPAATIQNYSLDYNGLVRDFVSPAPPLAQRPVYLGDRIFSRIFQIPEEEIDDRKKLMILLFREKDPARVSFVSREVDIHYLFVETKDAPRLSEIQKRLVEPYFSLLFQSGNALLFRVNAPPFQ